MDINIKIKEENPLSDDIASQNERECFTKYPIKQITYSNSCNLDTKTEIEEQTLVSDFGLENGREFVPEDPVMKYNSDHEMDNRVQIKEEPQWLETGSSSVCDDGIKDGDSPSVNSPRHVNEMDTKIEIKEEDPLSDDENVTMQMKSVKPETSFTQDERECFTKDPTCSSNNCHTQIEEQTLLSEDSVMNIRKRNSDHEMNNKVETSSIYNDIKVEDFSPVKSPRLCTEVVSSGLPLLSVEVSGKSTSFYNGKDRRESDVTEMSTIEKLVHFNESGKCSDGEINSRALYVKHKNLIHKGERSQKCNVFEKRLSYMPHLKMHDFIEGNKRPHRCKICDKDFARLSNLKRHNLIHEDKKPYKCELCEKRFSALSDLKRHNLIHEGKKPHECKTCNKSFTQLSSLKMHSLIHDGNKPYKCKICDKSFTQLSSLKRHKLIHDGEKPHKCETCDKCFTQLSSLKLHNLIHEGVKPFKCEICEKRFTALSDLKRHHLIHDGKKPHKCETCDRRFTQLSSLKMHNLIHEGKKPHKCKTCDKSFTRVCNLKVHNLIHQGKKPHTCKTCAKSFTQLSNLKAHNLIHQGKMPQKSKTCNKAFIELSKLKMHHLIH